jgi:hypothetical protein
MSSENEREKAIERESTIVWAVHVDKSVAEIAGQCFDRGYDAGAASAAAWVSTSERLPEPDVDCLLCGSNSGRIGIGYYDEGSGLWREYGSGIVDDIIAWMPLPAPYQPTEANEK